MGGRGLFLVVWLALLPLHALAEDAPVRLYAPPELVGTGLFKHILPRFSLKTRVRVKLGPEEGADIVLGGTGRALFSDGARVWHMAVPGAGGAGTDRFAEWLTSDIGQNTVQSYAPGGSALFGPPPEVAETVAPVSYDGDAAIGLEVSRRTCTRCHSVETGDRFAGIGSTPSFSVLRSLPDWADRFTAFYALNPHQSFTLIEEVSEPFPIERPPPIVPITLTLDEVEAVLAYVATMDAADLGAPLAHQ
ncbi:hypothetical protein [Salipiger sp.]|uniref:hypothetical protein n=1 Tax=Salipiger sp. TaxID=2078585 RepID=UPI003A9695BB